MFSRKNAKSPRKPGTGRLVLAAAMAFLLLAPLISGCSPKASGSGTVEPIAPVPSKDTVTLVLYFADDQAMEVLPERRTVEVPTDPKERPPMEKLVVEELLKGPSDPLLRKTLPPEAKLISVQVTDGVAFVNFSKELQTKHWGGSAGESMTIYSLVNSLTELPSIQKVQLLVEGKKVETLAGHFDAQEPFARQIRLDPGFFTSPERAKALQERVNKGEDSWRKEPLEVAKREAGGRGFLSSWDYKLERSKEGIGLVSVTFKEKTYHITLIQPEKKGADGIFVIKSISAK